MEQRRFDPKNATESHFPCNFFLFFGKKAANTGQCLLLSAICVVRRYTTLGRFLKCAARNALCFSPNKQTGRDGVNSSELPRKQFKENTH
jgi:hypothetical protein